MGRRSAGLPAHSVGWNWQGIGCAGSVASRPGGTLAVPWGLGEWGHRAALLGRIAKSLWPSVSVPRGLGGTGSVLPLRPARKMI